jgi:hypothetical protein
MKVDFSQGLMTLDGKPFEREKGVPATLGDMCSAALLSEDRTKVTIPEHKFKRWELTKKIYKQDVVDVTAEEIALIKECAGTFSPPLMGTIYDILEASK